MGTPEPAVPTLKKIIEDGHEVVAVWTQPDRPAGRGKKLKAPPVKEFALEKGIEVHQPTKIKNKAARELFLSHNADAAVVVAYGRILPKSFLEAFPKGCINVHFSLLPKYRGAAPVNWAIVRGETKTGITTMNMDAGLDTGDILLQSETGIGENENAVELMQRLEEMGAELLSETLAKIETIEPTEQDHEKATYAPLMSKDDGIIDWNKTAKEINDQIRGFQPFPRSFTNYKDQKLTIWKAEIFEDAEKTNFQNGEIFEANGDELLISCGEQTILKVNELQIEGKRRMETRDFLNGVQIEIGVVLG